MPLKTTKQFILDAELLYGKKYNYSQTSYTGVRNKIKIICNIHGKFTQTPNNHLSGHGCPQCVGKYHPTTQEFIKTAQQIHGETYDYSLVNYKRVRTKIKIICKLHGEFTQTPHSHVVEKSGCPVCAGNIRLTTADFIKQAQQVHGNKYDYSNVIYLNTHQKVHISCSVHGEFKQTPNNHISKKSECPKCVSTRYSQIAIDWLTYISNTQNISIQHAENVGEFTIPTTRYRVDGFCKETNTIYEFHGDAFHGNPIKYDPTDKCHPFSNLTAAKLYQTTMHREQQIKKLGYNLVVMWEQDWKQKRSMKLNQL